ncbi:MAG: hypothetical protein V1858_02140 [Candidatus Gottesmanbacteria bacterium]
MFKQNVMDRIHQINQDQRERRLDYLNRYGSQALKEYEARMKNQENKTEEVELYSKKEFEKLVAEKEELLAAKNEWLQNGG